MFKLCFCIFAGVVVAHAQLPSSANTPFCYYNERMIPVGGSVMGDVGQDCGVIYCDEPGSLSMLGCSPTPPEPGCYQSDYDLSLPYPQCCPQPMCDREY